MGRLDRGEPLDQLTPAVIDLFAAAGYAQQVETSGVKPVPAGLTWVTLSPKVAEHILARHFPTPRADGYHVDELKYVRHAGQGIPVPSLRAKYRCLSPHTDGDHVNAEHLRHCIALCLQYPEWRLSVQQHKVWRVR